MTHHVNITCQSHIWSSPLDHLKSNRAQQLNTSHHKALPELTGITILEGITVHLSQQQRQQSFIFRAQKSLQ